MGSAGFNAADQEGARKTLDRRLWSTADGAKLYQ
jgi:hypothetical protein